MTKDDLFKGKPAPELTPIQGIPLPEEAEEFFDEREDDDLLLNENSRLKPEDLQNKERDSIDPQRDNLQPQGLLKEEEQIEEEEEN